MLRWLLFPILFCLMLVGVALARDWEPGHNASVNEVLDRLVLVIDDMRFAKANRKGEQDWLLDELVELEGKLRQEHVADSDPALE
jgi:hypothetical protein